MTSLNKALYLFMLIFITSHLEGQFYSQGEDPASVKWEKIQTGNFSLIFPKGFYADANRFANLLEYYRPYSSHSLKILPVRIPVVVHTHSVISNGFVSWAPKRMEVVSLPGQSNYAQDWFEQLALHEYRHVVQVSKFRQGFTKGLSWIFGEMATGAVSALMPKWFMEGDAVVNETVLSSTGRGRLPSFDMEFRTIILDTAVSFSYDQAFMGTYNHFVPDYYQYGYHMVSYARVKYGPDFWEKMIDFSARNPYLLAPSSLFSLKNIGLNKDKLYKKMIDSIKFYWNSQRKEMNYNNYSIIISDTAKRYRQYKLPQQLSDNSIIAMKTGIDLLDQIIQIDSAGKETKLHIIGSSSELNLSATDNYVVWDEILVDPRWEGRSYSVIKSFNIHSHSEIQLTRRTRYFSPDISNDESKIVAIETDINNNNFLIILQHPDGKLLKRISSPGNKAIQYPEWMDSKKVLLVTFDGKEKNIETVNTETGEWETLFDAGTMDVSEPISWQKYVLFRASYNGIENIYAINLHEDLFQITSASFGAFNPAISADSTCLIYSNYTSNGFELVKIFLDTNQWVRVQPEQKLLFPWPEKLKQQEMIVEKPDLKNTFQLYKSTPYSKYANLFKFHSWLPFYLDVDENNLSIDYQTIKPGFILFSQNLLSTAFSTISYRYDAGYHIVRPSFTFKGWYPVFNFAAELGGPVGILPYPEEIKPPEIRSFRKVFTAKTYIPFFFTNNKYRKLIQPQLEYEWSNTFYYNGLFKTGLNFLHFRLYFYRYLRTTYRDLYPKWGQLLSLSFTDTPSDNEQFGKLWSTQVDFYFPGMFNHHSLRLNAGYQKQWQQKFYLPVSRIAFPRGYTNYISKEFFKLSANYSFPFLYPDYSLSWLLYIKRMTANLFYDTSYGTNIQEITEGERKPYTGIYNSTGIEIFMDVHLVRVIFPFQVGLRYTYLPVRNSHDFELLFSVNTDIF
jgi:hypothetical protein